ncbi:hypothetical protein [Pseudofrankia sp. BMG5.36]|uniref:hypothetical protein n=1 Tax=Pseudofrankia sp. BMG5.36 TaxID=1834512 RepID=UPI000AC8DA91|nr:hypothetical protein [Pseudofrankia sp. BMG5.36]
MALRKHIRVLALPVLFAAVVGCSGGSDPGATPNSEAQARPSSDAQQQPEGPGDGLTRLREYNSIAELATYSDLVVRVRGAAKVEEATVFSMPHVITNFDVVEVVRGKAPDTIRVRQVGSPGSQHILKADGAYLLFLRESEQAVGQYVIVGTVAGIFRDESGKAVRLDPESPDIPKEVQLDSLRAEVLDAPKAD